MNVRVLHVVESLEPQAGSVAICVGGLLRELERHGVSTDVLALRASAVDQRGATVANDRAAWRGAVERANLVHFHGWSREACGPLAEMALALKRPYVISPLGGLCRNPFSQPGLFDRLKSLFASERLAKSANAITAVNELERRELNEQSFATGGFNVCYGIDFAEYEQIYDKRRARAANGVKKTALVMGPIHPVEGLVPLLKAGAEVGLGADGWEVVFAGPEVGDWRKMVEAAVNRKGGAGRVRFVSAANEAEQMALLAGADLLVAPALRPRCPVSIYQGIAAGVPVIATRAVCPDGLEKLVTVSEPSRNGLRSALHATVTISSEERRARAEAAREAAKPVIDWSEQIESFVRLYESLGSLRDTSSIKESDRKTVLGQTGEDRKGRPVDESTLTTGRTS